MKVVILANENAAKIAGLFSHTSATNIEDADCWINIAYNNTNVP